LFQRVKATRFSFLQIFDKNLKQFQDSVSSPDPASSLKRPKRSSGAESVKNELDSLNRRYMEMVKWTNDRLKDIKATLAQANYDVQVCVILKYLLM
jgi:hypothetical protein